MITCCDTFVLWAWKGVSLSLLLCIYEGREKYLKISIRQKYWKKYAHFNKCAIKVATNYETQSIEFTQITKIFIFNKISFTKLQIFNHYTKIQYCLYRQNINCWMFKNYKFKLSIIKKLILLQNYSVCNY